MDMTGEYRIPAPRQRVWEALNDPEVLRQAIPGCEQLDKVSDTELTARVKAKVGPVSATFNGKVTLGDLNPPAQGQAKKEGRLFFRPLQPHRRGELGGPAGRRGAGTAARRGSDGRD